MELNYINVQEIDPSYVLTTLRKIKNQGTENGQKCVIAHFSPTSV
jgi:hypothetical protein